MIKRKTLHLETPHGQHLADRRTALDTRKASTLTRTDMGRAYRAQILAEIAVMEADLEVEIDQFFMVQELAAAQELVDLAATWAEDAVAATSVVG